MSSTIPAAALLYLSLLFGSVQTYAPEMVDDTPFLAGQVEQETCVSLKSSKCWSPRAENKMPSNNGEYGFGFGQITNTNSMDNFSYARSLHRDLRNWAWGDRFNPDMQLRALVLWDQRLYNVFDFAQTEQDRIAFMLCAYNGGQKGALRDRNICMSTPGCNPNVWFGNVEKHTWRNTKPSGGYRKSFFEINREYVRNIIKSRSPKYRQWYQNEGML